MLDLTIVEVSTDEIIATDGSGARYRLAVDDTLRHRLRRMPQSNRADPHVSPREVQAHIRAGLSAQQVAETTGAPLEYIERFEGAIIAEREHIVSTALAVTISRTAHGDDETTFGFLIRQRLDELDARGERWTSWREPDGTWFVKAEFSADDIDHDARWTFDVRKKLLEPVNAEAISLSSRNDDSKNLLPPLRAVTTPPPEDTTRFDSGAFRFDGDSLNKSSAPTRGASHINNAVPIRAIARSEAAEDEVTDTADLLESLRRHRGERQRPPLDDDASGGDGYSDDPTQQTLDFPVEAVGERVGASHPEGSDRSEPSHTEHAESSSRSPRKGRAPMPSWDEIVFGARGDDDSDK